MYNTCFQGIIDTQCLGVYIRDSEIRCNVGCHYSAVQFREITMYRFSLLHVNWTGADEKVTQMHSQTILLDG